MLRELGGRLGGEGEVVLVPGNHDYALVRAWVRERRRTLGVADAVPPDAGPTLTRVVAALAPAAVRVSYPGVWVAPGMWATHGHYLDRHLLPEGSVGLFLRRGNGRAGPGDYEPRRRPSLARATPLLPGPMARGLDSLADVVRASTMPRVQRTVLQRRFAPMTSRLLGVQMRRSSLPALARVVERLGVEAEYVVFGHVHRLGPLTDDEPSLWRAADGRPRIINTGSWLYEPRLLHGQAPPHPYWPGGAVVLEDGGAPEPIGLLDDLTAAQLLTG